MCVNAGAVYFENSSLRMSDMCIYILTRTTVENMVKTRPFIVARYSLGLHFFCRILNKRFNYTSICGKIFTDDRKCAKIFHKV